MTFINTKLLLHPVNWLTLTVWLVFLGMVIHIFDAKLQSSYSHVNKTETK